MVIQLSRPLNSAGHQWPMVSAVRVDGVMEVFIIDTAVTHTSLRSHTVRGSFKVEDLAC